MNSYVTQTLSYAVGGTLMGMQLGSGRSSFHLEDESTSRLTLSLCLSLEFFLVIN